MNNNKEQRNLVTSDKDTELFPEVDEAGNVVGQMSRAEAHDGTKRLHPVVHLHVFNSEGELYLQHRAKWKTVQPDKWDTATGGHIDWGEDVMTALAREVYEEIGMAAGNYTPKLVKTYIYENNIERELVYVFTTQYDGEPLPSPTETQGGKFWSINEIRSAIGKNILTPMFEKEVLFLIPAAEPGSKDCS
jgi:isopentenyldiphosphate isomerase